jgi:hypothetical protein
MPKKIGEVTAQCESDAECQGHDDGVVGMMEMCVRHKMIHKQPNSMKHKKEELLNE